MDLKADPCAYSDLVTNQAVNPGAVQLTVSRFVSLSLSVNNNLKDRVVMDLKCHVWCS